MRKVKRLEPIITPSPVDTVVKNLLEFLSVRAEETKYPLHLQAIAQAWPLDSRSEQFEKLVALFGMPKLNPGTRDLSPVLTTDKILPLLPDSDPSFPYIVNTILYLTPHDTTIRSFSAILKAFKLKRDYLSVADSRSIRLVGDGTIDLVLIPSLTHLDPTEKENLIRACARVLSPNGTIILGEHDYDKSTQMFMSLNILNTYLTPNLSFHPTSRDELEAMFVQAKLIPLKDGESKKDWTRSYCVSFQATTFEFLDLFKSYTEDKSKSELKVARSMKSKDLKTFDLSMTRLHDESPELPYSKYLEDYGAVAVDWGQLKLFVTVLQALVEYWDPGIAPDLTVVYAGAAPGNSVPILANFFPTIVWELYDPHPFERVRETSNIHIHGGRGEGLEDENGETGMFTDSTAALYAPSNLEANANIFFISDIRTRKYTAINKKDGEVGNRVVLEEMEQQDRWVKIINPYRAHLKTRLPYMTSENDLINLRSVSTYEGDLILQPFTNILSSETRLVPVRRPDGKYHKKIYDSLKYESQMAYHNAVTREAIVYNNPTTSDVPRLDNHYDSTFFLFVLQEYLEFLKRYRADLVVPRGIPIQDAVGLSKYVETHLNLSHVGKKVSLEAKRSIRRSYVKPL
jgi:SAM-dependent methyltransferase